MPSYVITGGRGLGLEFAKQLSDKPENLVFSLVRSKKVTADLNALEAERKNLHVLEADITDVLALKKAAEYVSKLTGGTLDVLINNAAWVLQDDNTSRRISEFAGDEELFAKQIHESIDVNVLGIFYTVNSFLPLLRAGKTKKVLTLSTGFADPELTIAARVDQSVAYSTSKAATNMIVAKYAVELQDEGFIFLAISPGVVDTGHAPQTPKQVEAVQRMVGGLKLAYPDWTPAPMTPTESVTKILAIVDTLKPEENGAFLSHKRSKEWL